MSGRSNGDTAERERVFFALMPPAPVAQEIAAAARALAVDGRAVESERLHLTLAFVGNVTGDQRDRLLDAGDTVRMPAFTLVIDRAGAFRRAGIDWLAPSAPPAALLDLVQKLYKNTLCGIDDRVFRPHITIARRAGALKAGAIAPIRWPVTDFSLMASGSQGAPGAYRELRRWPLLPGSVGPASL